MRLPADAVLLVFGAEALGDPRRGARSEVEAAIAVLVAAWRAEALPIAHIGGPSTAAPLAIPPLDGEIVVVREATSAFAGADLEARLDALGATTLVLCGALATPALEASARHAADLGYQVFVVADACEAADTPDLKGRLWTADDVRALALARLKGETATIVDVATTFRAAGAGQGAPAARGGAGLTGSVRPAHNVTRLNDVSTLSALFCNFFNFGAAFRGPRASCLETPLNGLGSPYKT